MGFSFAGLPHGNVALLVVEHMSLAKAASKLECAGDSRRAMQPLRLLRHRTQSSAAPGHWGNDEPCQIVLRPGVGCNGSFGGGCLWSLCNSLTAIASAVSTSSARTPS